MSNTSGWVYHRRALLYNNLLINIHITYTFVKRIRFLNILMWSLLGTTVYYRISFNTVSVKLFVGFEKSTSLINVSNNWFWLF